MFIANMLTSAEVSDEPMFAVNQVKAARIYCVSPLTPVKNANDVVFDSETDESFMNNNPV